MTDLRLKPKASPISAAQEAVDVIAEALGRLRFGSIAVTIHDGRIVQLDITEKRRLTS